MTNKLHTLFTHPIKPNLLTGLNLLPAEVSTLRSAREELEAVISAGFKLAKQKEKESGSGREVPLPRYAIQGSYIYKTLNSPAYPPKQQVDIDLGVYLPFTALEDGKRPIVNVQIFFDVIEGILREHIRKSRPKWTLQTGKKTCVRIVLNDKTHIDLPLYGVPDDQINRVIEARKQLAMNSSQDAMLFHDSWIDEVDPTVIHMAHREEGWIPSDPLVIRDWVKDECKNKGAEIRPICRYLKAWRDEHWKNGGGPSSIFLLAHTIDTFSADSKNHCDLLLSVINALPHSLYKPLLIPCPTPKDPDAKENLCDQKRISNEQKEEFQQAFLSLQSEFQKAKTASTPDIANRVLTKLFGTRFPFDPNRITVTSQTARKVVTSTAPVVHPLRSTDRSIAG